MLTLINSHPFDFDDPLTSRQFSHDGASYGFDIWWKSLWRLHIFINPRDAEKRKRIILIRISNGI